MAKPSRPSTDRNGRTGSRKAQATEDKEQSARFIKTARELRVDESGATFDSAVMAILPKQPSKTKHEHSDRTKSD